MKRRGVWYVALWCMTVLCISDAQGMKLEVREDTIKGRIYDATNQSGIPELTVRLIPPKSVPRPEKITTTDQNGEFRFSGVDKGKYLLEVYQGVTLLYRNVLDTHQDSVKEIELKRKGP